MPRRRRHRATGRRVVEQLAGVPSAFDVVAGVRSASAAASRLPANTATLTFDLASDDTTSLVSDLAAAMQSSGVTDVICAVGFSPTFVPDEDRRLALAVDYYGTLRLIAAAEAAKLSGRFVLVSSLGVNATSSSAMLLDKSLGNVLVQKRAAEEALARSRLDWCIVRPGLLLKEAVQGGIVLGEADRFTGDAERDGMGLGAPVKCASPFLASSGAVCAATRGQVAALCVEALDGDPQLFSRRVVEIVARPEVDARAPARGGNPRLIYKVAPPL